MAEFDAKGFDLEGHMSPHSSVDEETKSRDRGARESSKDRRKRKRETRRDGPDGNGRHRRRHAMTKAARDPRDEPSAPRKPPKKAEVETRSPSPVIDFDGLSRPSTSAVSLWPRPQLMHAPVL